jgi:uncharacterized protein (DUF924 family)
MHENAIDEILQFWFEDIEHSMWFKKDPEFDKDLEQRFGRLLVLGCEDQLDGWCKTPRGRLALIILLDQFSRNIHRGTSRCFDADPKALRLAVTGIDDGSDIDLSLEQRSFFYLPLRHAEDLEMQKLGLVKTRELNDAGYGSDKYALNHLELVERFGRFPHRNAALGRPSTAEENEYLKGDKAGF